MFTTTYLANWHAILLLAAPEAEATLPPAVRTAARSTEGGMEEAMVELPAFRGWHEWAGQEGQVAWLGAAVLRQPPPANTNGLPGYSRKVVARFQAVLGVAFNEIERRVAETGETAAA